MGTDRIRLFDKRLGDRILAMDQHGLLEFLKDKVDADAVHGFFAGDYTMPQVKSLVIQDVAFGNEEILIDYWGCYAKVFAGHPAGSISSLDYLPDEQEETFLLLRAEHVAQMTASLRAHMDDLSVMDAKQIEKIEEWQALCAANPNYWVAYQFDF